MKKLIIIAALALSFAAEVQATRQPQYRAVVVMYPVTCWAGGTDYPNGLLGGWGAVNTNSTFYLYAGLSNGYFIGDITPSSPCCGAEIHIAKTRSEVSYDGVHWYIYSDTWREVVMEGRESEFDVDSSGNLGTAIVRAECSGAGGGW